jgi:hypothetical protein
MVTNALILPGDELFNSYDLTLSNASLMMQYGFMLEGNSNDRIEWMHAEMDHILNFGHMDDDDKVVRLKLWEILAATSLPLSDLNVDELLFDPRELHHASSTSDADSMAEDLAEPPPRSDLVPNKAVQLSDPSMLLCIGADAQISQQLWLYLVLHRLPRHMLASFSSSHSDMDSSRQILTESVVKPLLRLLVADGDSEEAHLQTASEEEALLVTTRLIVDDLISLCRKKLDGMYMKDLSVQELGNLLVSD